LCLVQAYSRPGFPNPTSKRMESFQLSAVSYQLTAGIGEILSLNIISSDGIRNRKKENGYSKL
jgi:hypothetical protein